MKDDAPHTAGKHPYEDPEATHSDQAVTYRAKAEIRAVDELDARTAARLLRIINERHARRELAPDDVFLFPGVLSSQAIDAYGTRMAPNSMRNYLRDVQEGIALMNSHRTGGFLKQSELPIGRIFEGALEGDPLKVGEVGFDDQAGQELAVWHYMIRGLRTTDVETDDLIRAIEGGVIKDESITFSWYPDGQLTCSICGQLYWHSPSAPDAPICEHIAFVNYENEDGESERCFVWVENAHAYEGSLVWAGANPGAMIRKAAAYATELSAEDVDRLEHVYHTRLLPRTVHPIKSGAGRRSTGRDRSRTVGSGGENAPKEDRMDREAILSFMEGRLPADRLTELEAIEDDSELYQALLQELSGQADAAEEAAKDALHEVEELRALADIGEQHRDQVIEATVAARVRAQGNEFDAERYRQVLERSNDLAFIESERDAWQARAAKTLQGGPGQTRQAEANGDDVPQTAPAAAYR